MNAGLEPVLLIVTAAVLAAGPAHAHGAAAAAAKTERQAQWQQALARPALAVAAAFDPRGRLWLAAVERSQLWLRHSQDLGKTWSAPLPVNPVPERIAADGENRPKLAFGPRGEIYVSWTQLLDEPFAGHVRFARSLDDGKTFSTPITVNDDRAPISHRFESLAVDGRGHVWLVWLDKRDQAAALRRGVPYPGAALYSALSEDGGASFSAARKLADHSCECCRIALALDTDGVPVALWRHIFDGHIRDHALLRLDGVSLPLRASDDGWRLEGCPHHGPALSIAPDGVYHLAWFTGASGRAGLYYRRAIENGRRFTPPMPFGDPAAQPGRPQVLSLGREVWLAWKEFDGTSSRVRVMHSHDGGANWSDPVTLAHTAAASDHPQLLYGQGRVFLGWQTANEGFRLIGLGP